MVGKPKCGIAPLASHSPAHSRIIDGKEATAHSIPWQVEIGFYMHGGTLDGQWAHACGGTILSKQHVLSAAHCATCPSHCTDTPCNQTAGCNMQTCCYTTAAGTACFTVCATGQPSHVVAKEHSLTDNSDGQDRIEIKNWKIHENYDEKTLNYDYSLAFLMQPIALDDKAVPACLPTTPEMQQTDFFVQKTLSTSGWGLLSGGKQADVLMQLDVIGLSNEKCQNSLGQFAPVFSEMLCGEGAEKSTQTTCSGDSGGPLTYTNEKGVTTVVGVTSFVVTNWLTGEKCLPGYPFVFARVTSVLDWINTNIGNYVRQCFTKKAYDITNSVVYQQCLQT